MKRLLTPKLHLAAWAAIAVAILVAAAGVLPVVSGPPAHAATITVTTPDDELNSDGDCSLREAIQAANTDAAIDNCAAGSGTDTIVLQAATYTLSIPNAGGFGEEANETGDLDILSDMNLDGSGAPSTIIDGAGIDRVLDVRSGATATISNVTVQGGGNVPAPSDGAGIRAFSFTDVTVADSVVRDNTAGNLGGGVYNQRASLTIVRSTISGNTAGAEGGGIFVGSTDPILDVSNSTISGNAAEGNGGGGVQLTAQDFDGGGALSLTNVTVTNNTNDGIRNISSGYALMLKNTIVASQATGDDCSGGVTSLGHNLDSDNTCSLTDPDDIPSADPLLGPLQNNGGPTDTHALLDGSPAIDAADNAACPPTDQRGVVRPQGEVCDIGAYEREGGAAATATPTPMDTATPTTTATPTATPTSTPEPVLATPTDLTAQALSMSAISLEWTDNSIGEDGYEVVRDDGTGFVRITLLPPNAISYLDEGLEPETTYVYRVRAFIGTTQFSEFSDPAAATTFGPPTIALPWAIVNSTDDSNLRDGVMTLREAMLVAGDVLDVADLDADECGQLLNTAFSGVCSFTMFGEVSSIGFDADVFPADAPATISLSGPLPEVHGAIDGALGAFVAGVIVDGVTQSFDCFDIGSDANTISGLRITGCANGVHITDAADNLIGGAAEDDRNVIGGNGRGVFIEGAGSSGNEVHGNYIGTDAEGTAAQANGVGVSVFEGDFNRIGGADPGEGNVISGNDGVGVVIIHSAVANIVRGNRIGTDDTGLAPLPNGANGVNITNSALNLVGGTASGSGNVISGNLGAGIQIAGNGSAPLTANLIQGNLIGTDAVGLSAIANVDGGIRIRHPAENTIVGGNVPGAGNVISGNGGPGVAVSCCEGNFIQGNYIGTDVTGMSALSNLGDGVLLHSSENVVGGSASGAGNVISGNSGSGIGVEASSNTIQGNHIGTDADGATALPNSDEGIRISDAGNNIVGGAADGAHNVISGNHGDGVEVSKGSGNTLQGNLIGTDATGLTPLGNSRYGVRIIDGDDNVVGGSEAGAGNVISGNGDDGINVGQGSGNTIQGNRIGVDAPGTAALPNSGSGISVNGGENNVIGGTALGAGNVISGNDSSGMVIFSSNSVIQGNLIGTDATGLAALPNGSTGVSILNGEGNSLGSTDPVAGNVISGNGSDGVRILTDSTRVERNLIGTDVLGGSPLPNAGVGVSIGKTESAADNLVLRNTIAFNEDEGVFVGYDAGDGNTIQFNSIHSNGELGIRVDQAFVPEPSLTGALTKSRTDPLFVDGELTTFASPEGTKFIVDFYTNSSCDPSGFGEGEEHLDSLLLFTDADGKINWPLLTVPAAPGTFITATATDAAGGTTSEFSECVEVTEPPTVPASELEVRCLQDPLLPEAGDTLTITAQAVDADLNPIVLADKVEIWVDDRTGPVASGASADGVRQVTEGPLTSGQILHYACRVENDGGDVFTGWRKVVVEDSPVSLARPIFTADAYHKAIDIVFIGKGGSDGGYGAVPLESTDFLEDVEEAINDGYFGEGIFLKNQSKLNFWLALLPGDAFREDGPFVKDKCVLAAPVGWNEFLGYADTGAILHTDEFRDCARSGQRLFSAWTNRGDYPGVLLHETGHQPFGLADEYCCDGGYFEQSLFANLYRPLSDCEDDAPDVARSASDCHRLTKGSDRVRWWTSDPSSSDLMVDNTVPRALDIRRIQWLFDQCDHGLC